MTTDNTTPSQTSLTGGESANTDLTLTHGQGQLATPQTVLPPADNTQFAQSIPAKADLGFQSLKGYLRMAYIALFVLVAVVGSWTYFSTIQGAVIASGQVAVDGEPQVLQHIEGGIISEILVVEGDYVEANDTVMKLDATLIEANRTAAETNFFANEALMSRLLSEQDGSDSVVWLDSLTENAENPAVVIASATQEKLFNARRTALFGEVTRLEQQIAQLQDEDRGVFSEIRFAETELDLIAPELSKLQRLMARQLVPRARVTELERQQTRLLNQRGQLQSRRALISGSIREAQIGIEQLFKARQEETLTQLSEARTRADSFNESLQTADSRTEQIFVRAPSAGYVHKMSVKTIGGVVSPGQEIMQIIPEREKLLLTARVLPADIDQVNFGQDANVIFSTLNADAPPELAGTVNFISADSLINEVDGSPYFEVEVEVAMSEWDKLNGRELKPGMPADIFIQTRERTVLQYLLDPLRKTISRTMRDG